MLRPSLLKLLVFHAVIMTSISASYNPNDDDDTDYSQMSPDEPGLTFEVVEKAPLIVNPNPKLPCHALTNNYTIIPTQTNVAKISQMDKRRINIQQYNGNEVVFESPIRFDDQGAPFRTFVYYEARENDSTRLHRTRVDTVYDNCIEGTKFNKNDSNVIDVTMKIRINRDGHIENF